MPPSEVTLGTVKDVVLPVDQKNRYDIYFTDRRVAIVHLGRARRFETESLEVISILPPAFGVPAPITGSSTPNRQQMEEEIAKASLDELLQLSKKSTFYTYDEIREVKLVLSRSPRFEIFSEECESKFAPSSVQAEQLLGLVLSVEPLRSRLVVAGKWNVLREVFKTHP